MEILSQWWSVAADALGYASDHYFGILALVCCYEGARLLARGGQAKKASIVLSLGLLYYGCTMAMGAIPWALMGLGKSLAPEITLSNESGAGMPKGVPGNPSDPLWGSKLSSKDRERALAAIGEGVFVNSGGLLVSADAGGAMRSYCPGPKEGQMRLDVLAVKKEMERQSRRGRTVFMKLLALALAAVTMGAFIGWRGRRLGVGCADDKNKESGDGANKTREH
jgi:hypothetical protein